MQEVVSVEICARAALLLFCACGRRNATAAGATKLSREVAMACAPSIRGVSGLGGLRAAARSSDPALTLTLIVAPAC